MGNNVGMLGIREKEYRVIDCSEGWEKVRQIYRKEIQVLDRMEGRRACHHLTNDVY